MWSYSGSGLITPVIIAGVDCILQKYVTGSGGRILEFSIKNNVNSNKEEMDGSAIFIEFHM